MIFMLVAIFFVFGLIIGSFLNVVIFRLNTQRSFGGRSGCMTCMNKLTWYELIPVFSFLGLKGRCKNCKTKISIQYPLVEFLTGLVFALLFLKFQDIFLLDTFVFSLTYGYYVAIFSILIVIAVYDLKHKIIPDTLSLAFGVLSFAGLFFFHNAINSFNGSFLYWHIPTTLEFLSGIFTAFPFAFFWFVSGGRWMGFGDAKLALGIGWLLSVSFGLSALVVAFWSGAVIGICLIVLSNLERLSFFKNGKINNVGMKSEIPFAPFLVLGTFVVFILGLNLFGF